MSMSADSDPSALTTDALDKAVAQWRRDLDSLRELFETRLSAMDRAVELRANTVDRFFPEIDKSIAALKDLLEARIDGMDTATALLADNVRQVPTSVDKAIAALRTVLDGEINNVRDVSLEKFIAIEGTFASNALALTAALAAQKEAAAEQNKSNTLAINKSEQATKEASLANVAQTGSSLASQAATIADLKDRVVRLEAGGLATTTARIDNRVETGQSQASSYYRASLLIAGFATLISIVAIIAFVLKK